MHVAREHRHRAEADAEVDGVRILEGDFREAVLFQFHRARDEIRDVCSIDNAEDSEAARWCDVDTIEFYVPESDKLADGVRSRATKRDRCQLDVVERVGGLGRACKLKDDAMGEDHLSFVFDKDAVEGIRVGEGDDSEAFLAGVERGRDNWDAIGVQDVGHQLKVRSAFVPKVVGCTEEALVRAEQSGDLNEGVESFERMGSKLRSGSGIGTTDIDNLASRLTIIAFFGYVDIKAILDNRGDDAADFSLVVFLREGAKLDHMRVDLILVAEGDQHVGNLRSINRIGGMHRRGSITLALVRLLHRGVVEGEGHL